MDTIAYDDVETIGFDYVQRHRVELEARLRVIDEIRTQFPDWAERLGDDHIVDLSVLGKISDAALTSGAEILMNKNGLPITFAPGRNLMFLTLAAADAFRRRLDVLVGGMCETDFSGYPDCRNDAIKATQISLGLGMAFPLTIETPLMWIDKKHTWELVEKLDGSRFSDLVVDTLIHATWEIASIALS